MAQIRRHFFPFQHVFCICACLFLFSCGLDTIVTLDSPTVTYNISYYSTEDYTKWYVDFLANASSDYPDDFAYRGTEVYYKIYNSASTLSSHKSAISSVNTASNYSEAATRVITTYGYKPLGTSASLSWSPFVQDNGRERVQIRLKSYKAAASPDYSALYHTNACIVKNGEYYATNGRFTYDSGAGEWKDADGNSTAFSNINFVIPYRNGNQYSFDFFDDNDTGSSAHREPQEGDEDYQYTSSASTDTYYVQLYAVAEGNDSNYTVSRSLVLDLGTIPIKKED